LLRSERSKRSPRRANGQRLTVVDLFAGAGGISEGFRQAGFDVRGGLDSDPDAAATYALNFPEAATISGDIRERSVRARLNELLQGVDVVVGGPPCQAFSQVRNHSRMIDDPRNNLYREFVAAIRFAKPMAFVMENVTGIDQMGVREQIVTDLSLRGDYRVVPQVLDAADFGVPQTRKRLLFMGIRHDLDENVPVLSGTGATEAVFLERIVTGRGARYQVRIQQDMFHPALADALDDAADDAIVTAAQAISDLAGLPVGNRADEIDYTSLPAPQSRYQELMRVDCDGPLTNVQVPRINEDTAIRLRGIPKGGNHRDLRSDLLERYITGQRWGQDNGSGRLSRRHFYAYRRLHPNIWAWTLNTKGDSVYHYEALRSLSVREFARLQSFPDRFVFTTDPRKGSLPGRHDGGPAHSRYRQVGNAVPPLLAREAATQLLSQLSHSTERAARRAKTG
jgi:DNA (cytosine-5)-methyltransferase 1